MKFFYCVAQVEMGGYTIFNHTHILYDLKGFEIMAHLWNTGNALPNYRI